MLYCLIMGILVYLCCWYKRSFILYSTEKYYVEIYFRITDWDFNLVQGFLMQIGPVFIQYYEV